MHVAGWAEVGVGFFGVFGSGFETGEEIRNDLESEEDGEKRSGVEEGMEIGGGAAKAADSDEGDEDNEDHAGHGFLKVGTETDAAVVDGGEEEGERDAEEETREKNRLASDAVEHETIERRKNVGGDFADGDGFPGTDDEVGEEHHPASEIADEGRENLGGVGGFTRSVWEPLDPLAIDVADGKQNDAANGKSESSAERAAAAEPVVHEDEPAGANHGAESESEIIVEAKFACESGGHLEDAEQFVEEVGGE